MVATEKPLVSICIPTYNAERTFRKTLSSIVSQTYDNLEIIVVDNKSTDDTVRIAEEFRKNDPRIKIIINPENIGGEANFRRCVEVASGHYTAVFHADDLYEPAIIEEQVRFLENHHSVGAVFVMATLIDDNDNILGVAQIPDRLRDTSGWVTTHSFREIFSLVVQYGNFFVCPSAMVRTEIFKSIDHWNFDLFGTSADLGTWFYVLENHTIGFLPKPLMSYRLSASQGGAQYQRMNTERANFFRVIDYFIKKHQISLNQVEQRGLRFLELQDKLARSMNHLILGNRVDARKLSTDSLSMDMIYCTFFQKPSRINNRSKVLIWLAGIALYFFTLFPKTSLLSKFLYKIKYERGWKKTK